MIVELVLAAALAGPPLAAASGPAATHPLRVVSVEGVPPDSVTRTEFMAGFDEALSSSAIPIEQPGAGGEWQPAGTRANRFERTDDPKAEDAWSLQVVVRSPPPFAAKRYNPRTKKSERYVDPGMRASRGMTVALLVLSPEAITAGARAMPEHAAFAFPQAAAQAGGVREATEGFRFPWREAGRATATLSLELLHRRSGDFGDGIRCDLAPALRADVVR